MNFIAASLGVSASWHTRGSGQSVHVIGPLREEDDCDNGTSAQSRKSDGGGTNSPSHNSHASLLPTVLTRSSDGTALQVWNAARGSVKVKHWPIKSSHRVVYAVVDGTHSGVFYRYRKQTKLGFALLQHDASEPSLHKRVAVVDFSARMHAVLECTMPLAQLDAEEPPACCTVDGASRERSEAKDSLSRNRHAALAQVEQSLRVLTATMLCTTDNVMLTALLACPERSVWYLMTAFLGPHGSHQHDAVRVARSTWHLSVIPEELDARPRRPFLFITPATAHTIAITAADQSSQIESEGVSDRTHSRVVLMWCYIDDSECATLGNSRAGVVGQEATAEHSSTTTTALSLSQVRSALSHFRRVDPTQVRTRRAEWDYTAVHPCHDRRRSVERHTSNDNSDSNTVMDTDSAGRRDSNKDDGSIDSRAAPSVAFTSSAARQRCAELVIHERVFWVRATTAGPERREHTTDANATRAYRSQPFALTASSPDHSPLCRLDVRLQANRDGSLVTVVLRVGQECYVIHLPYPMHVMGMGSDAVRCKCSAPIRTGQDDTRIAAMCTEQITWSTHSTYSNYPSSTRESDVGSGNNTSDSNVNNGSRKKLSSYDGVTFVLTHGGYLFACDVFGEPVPLIPIRSSVAPQRSSPSRFRLMKRSKSNEEGRNEVVWYRVSDSEQNNKTDSDREERQQKGRGGQAAAVAVAASVGVALVMHALNPYLRSATSPSSARSTRNSSDHDHHNEGIHDDEYRLFLCARGRMLCCAHATWTAFWHLHPHGQVGGHVEESDKGAQGAARTRLDRRNDTMDAQLRTFIQDAVPALWGDAWRDGASCRETSTTSTTQAAMTLQHLYEGVLQTVRPRSQQDYDVLWLLTRAVQQAMMRQRVQSRQQSDTVHDTITNAYAIDSCNDESAMRSEIVYTDAALMQWFGQFVADAVHARHVGDSTASPTMDDVTLACEAVRGVVSSTLFAALSQSPAATVAGDDADSTHARIDHQLPHQHVRWRGVTRQLRDGLMQDQAPSLLARAVIKSALQLTITNDIPSQMPQTSRSSSGAHTAMLTNSAIVPGATSGQLVCWLRLGAGVSAKDAEMALCGVGVVLLATCLGVPVWMRWHDTYSSNNDNNNSHGEAICSEGAAILWFDSEASASRDGSVCGPQDTQQGTDTWHHHHRRNNNNNNNHYYNTSSVDDTAPVDRVVSHRQGAPSLAIVAVRPYALSRQDDFDTTLGLAGDVLSLAAEICATQKRADMSMDTTATASLCLAIFTLALSHRVSALDVLLRHVSPQWLCADALNAITTSPHVLQRCSAIVLLSPSRQFSALLSCCRSCRCSSSEDYNESSNTGKVVQSNGKDDVAWYECVALALCCAAAMHCVGRLAHHKPAFTIHGLLIRHLSVEFDVISVTAVLWAATDALLAAQNNLSVAMWRWVMVDDNAQASNIRSSLSHVASSHADAERVAAALVAQRCRERCAAARGRLRQLWQQHASLLPYSYEQLSQSYQAAVSASFGTSKSNSFATASNDGTIVTRSLVVCFRMYALLRYAAQAESALQRSLREAQACTSTQVSWTSAAALEESTFADEKIVSVNERTTDAATSRQTPVRSDPVEPHSGACSSSLPVYRADEKELQLLAPVPAHTHRMLMHCLTAVQTLLELSDGALPAEWLRRWTLTLLSVTRSSLGQISAHAASTSAMVNILRELLGYTAMNRMSSVASIKRDYHLLMRHMSEESGAVSKGEMESDVWTRAASVYVGWMGEMRRAFAESQRLSGSLAATADATDPPPSSLSDSTSNSHGKTMDCVEISMSNYIVGTRNKSDSAHNISYSSSKSPGDEVRSRYAQAAHTTGPDGIQHILPRVIFRLSHQSGVELPSWPHSHALPARRHLLDFGWVDALWRVERIPRRLREVCDAAVADLLDNSSNNKSSSNSDQNNSNTNTDDIHGMEKYLNKEDGTALSPILSQPLYDSVRLVLEQEGLVAPLTAHATTNHSHRRSNSRMNTANAATLFDMQSTQTHGLSSHAPVRASPAHSDRQAAVNEAALRGSPQRTRLDNASVLQAPLPDPASRVNFADPASVGWWDAVLAGQEEQTVKQSASGTDSNTSYTSVSEHESEEELDVGEASDTVLSGRSVTSYSAALRWRRERMSHNLEEGGQRRRCRRCHRLRRPRDTPSSRTKMDRIRLASQKSEQNGEDGLLHSSSYSLSSSSSPVSLWNDEEGRASAGLTDRGHAFKTKHGSTTAQPQLQVTLLHFKRVLAAPDTPSSRVDGAPVPQTRTSLQPPQPLHPCEPDSGASGEGASELGQHARLGFKPIVLGCTRQHMTDDTSSNANNYNVYSFCAGQEGAVERSAPRLLRIHSRPTAKSSLLAGASTSTNLHIPPVPASEVFVAPPPLLHLPTSSNVKNDAAVSAKKTFTTAPTSPAHAYDVPTPSAPVTPAATAEIAATNSVHADSHTPTPHSYHAPTSVPDASGKRVASFSNTSSTPPPTHLHSVPTPTTSAALFQSYTTPIPIPPAIPTPPAMPYSASVPVHIPTPLTPSFSPPALLSTPLPTHSNTLQNGMASTGNNDHYGSDGTKNTGVNNLDATPAPWASPNTSATGFVSSLHTPSVAVAHAAAVDRYVAPEQPHVLDASQLAAFRQYTADLTARALYRDNAAATHTQATHSSSSQMSKELTDAMLAYKGVAATMREQESDCPTLHELEQRLHELQEEVHRGFTRTDCCGNGMTRNGVRDAAELPPQECFTESVVSSLSPATRVTGAVAALTQANRELSAMNVSAAAMERAVASTHRTVMDYARQAGVGSSAVRSAPTTPPYALSAAAARSMMQQQQQQWQHGKERIGQAEEQLQQVQHDNKEQKTRMPEARFTTSETVSMLPENELPVASLSLMGDNSRYDAGMRTRRAADTRDKENVPQPRAPPAHHTRNLHTPYDKSKRWRPVPSSLTVSHLQKQKPQPRSSSAHVSSSSSRRRSGAVKTPQWVPERLRMYAQQTVSPSARRGGRSSLVATEASAVTQRSSSETASGSVVHSDKLARRIAKLSKELM